jgi:amino acid transporter
LGVTPWESFETAVEICSIFFAVLGVGFVSFYVLFDDRLDPPSRKFRPYARFTFSTLCAMLVCIGLFLWLLFGFPDHDDPTDPPPTLFEEILQDVCIVAMWPMVLASYVLHRDPPLMPLWLLPTGFFWAFVAELPFILRARSKRKLHQN